MTDKQTTQRVIDKATPLPTPEGGWSKPQEDVVEKVGEETDENGASWTVYRIKKERQHER